MCNHVKHEHIDKQFDMQLITLYCFNEGENILQDQVNTFPIFLKMLTTKLISDITSDFNYPFKQNTRLVAELHYKLGKTLH